MPHDVFISYSHIDKSAADAACATLEAAGIRCWIAPRDISPGEEWGEAIIKAIDSAPVMVLIFSSNTNESRQVRREVEHAVSQGVTIMPMRIEQVAPARSLAYFMAGVHWLDALTPPLEQHLQRLAASIKALLKTTPASPAYEPSETILSDTASERPRELSRGDRGAGRSAARSRKSIILIFAALLVIGAAVIGVIQTGALTPPATSKRESAPPTASEPAAAPATAPAPAPAAAPLPAPPPAVPPPAVPETAARTIAPVASAVPEAPPERGAPGPTAPVLPTPGPVAVAPVPTPKPAGPGASPLYDGLWVGIRRCAEWNGRQALQNTVRMRIENNKAASITGFPVDAPGYVTYQGSVEQNGTLLLRGYGISGGVPGGLPRGSHYPFVYEGAISGDRYSAKDIGVPRPCTVEMTRQH